MNGQSIPARQLSGIHAALIASCLMHAVLIFLPYLGESTRESTPKFKTTEPRPQSITATLSTLKKTPFVLPIPPVQPPEPAVVKEAEPEPPIDPQPVQEHREGADVLPIDAPAFYPVDQLTQRPQLVDVAELDTPEIKPIVASGKMVMKLWINDLGEVVEAEIEKTDLPEIFVKSAQTAFKHMRFSPGERQGKHVGSVMRIEVTYDDGRKPPEPPQSAPPQNQPQH